MADFAVMITAGSKTNLIDSVDRFEISESNEITERPMVSGDLISDHIIIKPCTITCSGTFSMNGSTKISNLATIQKQYEDIKDNGTLCTVAKVKNVTNEFRFLKRRNMVLTGIVWTEQINSLGFSFTFTQALLENVIEVTSVSEEKYPDTVELSTSSFEGSIISKEEVFSMVQQSLLDSGILTEDFLDGFAKALGGVALVGGAVATAWITGELVAAGALASTGIGAPLALGAVALAGVTLLAAGIADMVAAHEMEKTFKYKKFETKEDWEEQNAEYKRYINMMNEIYAEVEFINNEISCYSLSSTEAQEALINIGGNYYIFAINRKNDGTGWKCKIEDISNNNVVKEGSITTQKSYKSCNSGNQFAKVGKKNEYMIFFAGPDKKDLATMSIVVSKINASEIGDRINKAVDKAIKRDD